jgi:hypothetical protein
MSDTLIACCGLVCTDCPAYRATQNSDRKLAEQTAKEWSAQFGVEVRVEHVWCDGCTEPGKKCAHCGECEIRTCALKRGFATCAECGDYPCKNLAAFFLMAPPARATLDALRK